MEKELFLNVIYVGQGLRKLCVEFYTDLQYFWVLKAQWDLSKI